MDAVSGLLSIMFKGDSGEVYNVSYEKSVASIAEVALAVAKLCGTNVVYDVPSSIEAAGYSTPQNCILDNRKLKGLGWEGQYSLRDGLNSTIKILKEMQSYS